MSPKFTRREFLKSASLGSASVVASATILPTASARQVHRDNASNVAQGETSRKQPAVIENQQISIAVDSATGDIVSLRNKRSGHEYISARQWAKAFRLNVPFPGRITGFNADYSANALDSWTQAGCKITEERAENGQLLTVTYPELKSDAGTFPIEVSYTIDLKDFADEAVLQVRRTKARCEEGKHSEWLNATGAI